MEHHAARSNNIVCDIPKDIIETTLNSELTVTDERKKDKEFCSDTEEMMGTKFVSDINEENSSETLKISLAGAQVGYLKKKLLVLDMNGLLVDIVFPPPNDHKADAIFTRAAMFKRPFCLEFLKFCFENFEVGIWSAGSKEFVEQVIDCLMGDMKNKLLFCWDESHCTKTSFNTYEHKHKRLKLKDLRKIWDKQHPNLHWEKGYYNESNTLLLDDSPCKALLNPPHTSVFPHTFRYQHKSDRSLAAGGNLREYIGGLANVGNMPKYVEEHPFGQEAINATTIGGDLHEYIGGPENVENMPKYAEEQPFGQEGNNTTSESWNYHFLVIGSLSSCQPKESVCQLE